MTEHELQIQQKRELENKRENTFPARMFVPAIDVSKPIKR